MPLRRPEFYLTSVIGRGGYGKGGAVSPGSARVASALWTFLDKGSAFGAGSSSAATTGSVNTTGANFLVAGLGYFYNGGAGVSAITDSKGNSWTPLTLRTDGLVAASRIWYCFPPANKVGTGHVFANTGDFPCIGVAAFQSSGSPAYGSQESGNSTASGTSLATGPLTPALANSLIISSIAENDFTGGTVPAVDSGMTAVAVACGGGANLGGGLGWKIQAAPTLINATWSWPNTTFAATDLAIFTP